MLNGMHDFRTAEGEFGKWKGVENQKGVEGEFVKCHTFVQPSG